MNETSATMCVGDNDRCFLCRKKVGLLGFECRCGFVFCSGHRHPQDHACAFDFASMDKARLAKSNPKVIPAKMVKF
jgi:predicted nucleic acid binding AN1-type Zn finger protein